MDIELRFIDRIRKWFTINRLDRLMLHYEAIMPQLAPKSEKERQEAEYFSKQFLKYSRLTNRLMNIRFVFYAILYAALLVNVLKLIPFLQFLVTFVELGNAFLGTTFTLAIIFLLSIKIRLYLELMQDCMTHLVALYHKNPKRDTETALKAIAKAI